MFLFKDVIRKTREHKSNRLMFHVNDDMSSSDWINNFVYKRNWLVIIDDQYLYDNFNFFGIDIHVNGYKSIVNYLRGQFCEFPPSMTQNELNKETEKLYSLLHSRYIMTSTGCKKILQKYESGVYGECPRVGCNQQHLLPIGITCVYGDQSVKTYCPCCKEIYETDSEIDGASFGPSFPHFLIQTSLKAKKFEEPVQCQKTIYGIPIEPNCPLSRDKGLSYV